MVARASCITKIIINSKDNMYKVNLSTFTKVSVAVSTVVGGVFAVLAVVLPSAPSEPRNPGVYGIWSSRYSYPSSNGTVEINGTTEYLKNGSYNFTGQMKLEGLVDKQEFRILYDVDGAGEWSADSKSIIIKLMDIKSHPKFIEIDSKRIDPKMIVAITGKDFPALSDAIPKGTSDEFTIVQLEKDSMVLQADDPKGHLLAIQMNRETHRFQR